jgi:hypothetical protein
VRKVFVGDKDDVLIGSVLDAAHKFRPYGRRNSEKIKLSL